MTPVLTKPRPAPPRSRGDLVVAVVAAVVAAALFAVVIPTLRLPPFVDSVTVSNPHVWHVEVEVGRPDGSRWIGLGHVGRGNTVTFRSVIDPGDEWAFRFAYGGIEQAQLVISRAELERSKWAVTIPDTFAERMRATGESPTA